MDKIIFRWYILKTVYIKEKTNLSKRKIRKIGKKLEKIKKKEPVIAVISDNLKDNADLIEEIEMHKIKILNR